MTVPKTISSKTPVTLQKNRLAEESSPYLQQHSDNPIWWYPWCPEAFSLAKQQDKPVFLSVGYSTCHWCHVMEGDSFEKEDVAQILNTSFISIKVDREERPDVDAIYMTAVQAMTHHGGWPMTLFLTPDGKPFWAGTFLPREQFKQVASEIARLWASPKRDSIEKSGNDLAAYVAQVMSTKKEIPIPTPISPVKAFLDAISERFDHKSGGFSEAPKFPSSMPIMTLFRIFRKTGNKRALEMAIKTLDEIARGGIHDHLGGGFHRYSTDQDWLIPHFEKMLYDNALLLMAYVEAFQITNHQDYAVLARDITTYLLRDMRHSESGFFSAEDADSERTEGKFYVWTEAELLSALTPEEFHKIKEVYSTTPEGNFHVERRIADLEKAAGMEEVLNGNIFFLPSEVSLPSENDLVLKAAKEKLLAIRAQRTRPPRDEKCLAAWNGLAIAALAKAGAILGDPRLLKAATQTAEFVVKKLITVPPNSNHKRLSRFWKDAQSKGEGFLEDYAAVVMGFIDLYQASGQSRWLELAKDLQLSQDELFWDAADDCYFATTGLDPTILVRSKDFADTACPSGNAMSAWNALRLGHLTQDHDLLSRSEKVSRANQSALLKYPMAFSFMIGVMTVAETGMVEVTRMGPAQSTQEDCAPFWKDFFPNTVLIHAPQVQLAWTYCHNKTCSAPTSRFSDIATEIRALYKRT